MARRSAAQAAHDRSGSALIEFALIAPILVTLLLGMFDLGPALLAKFKIVSATASVADITTQSSTVQTSDIVSFFNAGGDVLAPFSSANLTLRITSIASNNAARAYVYWSCGQGSLPPLIPMTTLGPTSLPNGVSPYALLSMFPGVRSYNGNFYIVGGFDCTVIMVESQYTFTPPAGFVIPSAQTYTGAAFALPRISTYIGPTTGAPGFTPVPPSLVVAYYTTTSNGVTCNFGM